MITSLSCLTHSCYFANLAHLLDVFMGALRYFVLSCPPRLRSLTRRCRSFAVICQEQQCCLEMVNDHIDPRIRHDFSRINSYQREAIGRTSRCKYWLHENEGYRLDNNETLTHERKLNAAET
jgi:hypothetical protein